MTKVFIVTFLMAFTFLLICWVVTRAWRMMLADTLHNARYFTQEKIRSENKTTFLFGTDNKNKKKKAV